MATNTTTKHFNAGSNLLGGNYSRDNLKIIVRWKSPRKIAYIDDNTDIEIARALRFASDRARANGRLSMS